MAKPIIWSFRAQQDRKAILEYWIMHNQSNLYSKKLNQIFEDTAELVSRHPNIGKKTDVPEVRIKIIKDYYFTYREDVSHIEILTIWDSRRNPKQFIKTVS